MLVQLGRFSERGDRLAQRHCCVAPPGIFWHKLIAVVGKGPRESTTAHFAFG
jgi:hypothetical protein